MKTTFSIVSHQQLALARPLLQDLLLIAGPEDQILLTLNTPEDESALASIWPQPALGVASAPIRIVRNAVPKGFGANHNQAFRECRGDVFVVVNPDICCGALNLADLLAPLGPVPGARVGAVAPVVVGPDGRVQDSVRKWPTLGRFARRLSDRLLARPRMPDYSWGEQPIVVDWAAGMFIAFDAQAFAQVGGFDERYFMYLEDADIGRRLARAGWQTLLQPSVQVVHDARRASFRSPRHMAWHLASAWRFLRSG